MDKRYQVFVSSTFEDLKEERKAVIETLLNATHIPAGMELFSASNNEQFKYIKKIIDNCDYYILIIGARYGSINPSTGISFTEQEYDYAISKGIPVLVFLHSDPDNLPVEKREDDKKVQLEAFKSKVSENRMCRPWNNATDLIGSVLNSLNEEISENPQLGWTRGNSFDNTELLSQINDLRIEKETQEKEIEKLNEIVNSYSNKVENLAYGNDTYLIKGEIYYSDDEENTTHISVRLSWDKIFSLVGANLFSYVDYISFKKLLIDGIDSIHNDIFVDINNDCAQDIKLQFYALGLIDIQVAKSQGGLMVSKSQAGTINEFISLTQKGKDYLMQIKTIKKT